MFAALAAPQALYRRCETRNLRPSGVRRPAHSRLGFELGRFVINAREADPSGSRRPFAVSEAAARVRRELSPRGDRIETRDGLEAVPTEHCRIWMKV